MNPAIPKNPPNDSMITLTLDERVRGQDDSYKSIGYDLGVTYRRRQADRTATIVPRTALSRKIGAAARQQ
jgi:hypothetical protein